jgi:hypothetical protein
MTIHPFFMTTHQFAAYPRQCQPRPVQTRPVRMAQKLKPHDYIWKVFGVRREIIPSRDGMEDWRTARG